MTKKRFWIFSILALMGVVWLSNPTKFSAKSERIEALTNSLENKQDRGIAYFAFGDFGALSSETLQTSGAPWKYMVAALALQEVNGDSAKLSEVTLPLLFQRYGFLTPKTIANWPKHLPKAEFEEPLGLNVGQASHSIWPISVSISNTGCAACHASVTYNPDGTPDPGRVWLGMPNGSINLQAYADDVFSALRDYGADIDSTMDAVTHLFPDTIWQERMTLRYIIAPIIGREISERDASIGRLLPFSGGLPGATNGLNALEYRLGLIAHDTLVEKSVFNSIPELGGRVWRTGLLNTNSYAVPEKARLKPINKEEIDEAHLHDLGAIITYFTVPSMGVSSSVAEKHIDETSNITAWMKDYKPQPFPGKVEANLLSKGQRVYETACSACHGTYDDDLKAPKLKSFPNWLGEVGTDRARTKLTGERLAKTVNAGLYGRYIAAKAAEGYIAPPLTGIWSSAPYLHNGSVPTLWHFMNPQTRPKKFVVGGHALDFERVGIAGVDDRKGGWMPPENHKPWALSAEIDTTKFGLGNQGHEAEFAPLSSEDKKALLEYLKLL